MLCLYAQVTFQTKIYHCNINSQVCVHHIEYTYIDMHTITLLKYLMRSRLLQLVSLVSDVCINGGCFVQGMVCLDILKDQWTPAFSIEKILLSIHCLLQECNPGKLSSIFGQALIPLCHIVGMFGNEWIDPATQ